MAVAPLFGSKGDVSVTIGHPGAASGGRHRADPDAARPGVLTIEEFNELDPDAAAATLGACLDVPEWIVAVAAGRPYPQASDLYAAGAAAAAVLSWPQVSGALDRHPRIGQRRAAAAGGATEQAWSAAEQSGVANQHAQALATGNADYEQRFGHLFLICASGLSGEEILSALRSRLSNEPDAERDVVAGELRKIAALRLAKAVRQ